LAASFSAYGTFKSILMGELSVSVGHGDRWRTVGDHRHRQRSRNLPKVAKGNCRKPTQKVETPQDPNRALGRINTGGVVRHTSQPTIETTGRARGLLMAAAPMRGDFLSSADLPLHPRCISVAACLALFFCDPGRCPIVFAVRLSFSGQNRIKN
jgi:hypothetical protein